jgi:hypothetical protein
VKVWFLTILNSVMKWFIVTDSKQWSQLWK